MRTLFLIAGLAAVAGPALAQSVGASGELTARRLEVQGEATPACILEEAQMNDLENFSSSSGDGGATLTLSPQQFIDSSGFLTASSARISFRVVCSGAHTLTVSSARGGLKLADPVADAAGFSTEIDMDVALSWAQLTSSFDTADGGQTAQVEVADAAAGLADLVIAIPAMSERLVAGVYSDELVIQLTPDD